MRDQKRFAAGVSMLMLVTLALASPVGAQPRGPTPTCSSLACDVQAEFDRTRALVLGVANTMPEERFSFRPTEGQRTFAEQLLHIAAIDMLLMGTLGSKTPAPKINEQAATKADVLAELVKAYDFDAAVLQEFATDAQLLARVRSVPFMGPTVSRVRVVTFSLTHAQDIYGQLVVYLRLNGLTPPASARP